MNFLKRQASLCFKMVTIKSIITSFYNHDVSANIQGVKADSCPYCMLRVVENAVVCSMPKLDDLSADTLLFSLQAGWGSLKKGTKFMVRAMHFTGVARISRSGLCSQSEEIR